MRASEKVRHQNLIHPRPWYPTQADQRRTSASTTIPTVTVTAAGSANADGSWVQLIASTAIEASGFSLRKIGTFANGVNTSMLMDIYVGDGALNPVSVIVDDYQLGFSFEQAGQISIYPNHFLPIYIPQGVQVIGRIRCATASRSVILSMDLVGDGRAPTFKKCTTYGAVPASSAGTTLTAPGGNNAEAAWTELSAAITDPIYAIGYGLGVHGTTVTNATLFHDIGAGAGGSERVVVADLYSQNVSNPIIGSESPMGRFAGYLDQPIGIGERLVARYQASNAASVSDLIVYGFS
jgi:hypothetical protein